MLEQDWGLDAYNVGGGGGNVGYGEGLIGIGGGTTDEGVLF